MGTTSKDLLEIEVTQKLSFLESSFLVCNSKDPVSKAEHRQAPSTTKGKLETTPIPTSQILGKVKDFLGAMAEANRRLQLDARENSRGNYDIEVLNGNESYIEMDLMLGVADLHTPEAVAAAESAMAGSVSAFPPPNSSGSDSVDSSDDDDDQGDPSKDIKKEKLDQDSSSNSEHRKKRPKITELS